MIGNLFPKIAAVLALVLMNIVLTPRVHACTRGASDNIQDLLSRAQYVVKADVVAVDDARQNGVLHIESVLFGGAGPEYALLVQTDPVIVTRITEGDPYGNCNFLKDALYPGTSGYFFLTRRADGAYLSATHPWDASIYVFPDERATITFYSRGDDNQYTERVLTESEFIDFIAEFGASAPPDPISGADYARPTPVRIASEDYPRLAPLQMVTSAGTNYILPVDSSVPVEATTDFLHLMTIEVMGYDSTGWNETYFSESFCPGDGCVQASPDGINRARQRGEQIEWYRGSAAGQAFLFSSTGEAIAIWNGNRLEFYTLGWQKASQNFREVVLLNAVSLAANGDTHPYQASWTPNGRMIAFSDADGLWLLDVYDENSEPSLLLPAEGGVIPIAISFSPLGRYVQVEHGSERLTLDTVSGDTFPDGLVSPDDRLLLAFDTQADEFNLRLCYLAPVRECERDFFGTIVRTGPNDSDVFNRFTQVMWRTPTSYIYAACERDEPERCLVDQVNNNHYGGHWNNDVVWSEGYLFDYFESGDTLAIVQDSYTLSIDGSEYDLSGLLDSPIVHINWLPTLFYETPKF